jgi:hypothetical protein
MDDPTAARVLVVAHRVTPTPALLVTVRERALQSPARFTLPVPGGPSSLMRVERAEDVEDPMVRSILRLGLPGIRGAARGPVEALIGGHDPVAAVSDAVNLYAIDEIIVSTPSPRVSRWLRVDLAHRLDVLGLPITSVAAPSAPVPAFA